MAIEGAVKDMEGVEAVEVDVQAKSVTVDFDPGTVSLETVEAAVQEEGYEVAGRHVFDR
jgi:copper chaperone